MGPHPVSLMYPPSPPVPHNALGQSPGSQAVTGEVSPAKAKVKGLTRLQLKGLSGHPCGSNLLGTLVQSPPNPTFQSPQPPTLMPREGWSDSGNAEH